VAGDESGSDDAGIDETADDGAASDETRTDESATGDAASEGNSTDEAARDTATDDAPAGGSALSVDASFGPQRLKTVLKRGLTGTATCSTACTVSGAIRLGGRTISKAPITSAGSTPTAQNRLKLELTPAAKRKLKKLRRVKLTIEVTARSGAATATAARAITLKR
jgi:hypothetical protein